MGPRGLSGRKEEAFEQIEDAIRNIAPQRRGPKGPNRALQAGEKVVTTTRHEPSGDVIESERVQIAEQ